MNAWFTDPEFLDDAGAPRVLPEFGELSFDALVRKHSGDMPRRALLEELLAGGMAARESSDYIKALRRHHLSPSVADADIEQLGTEIDVLMPASASRASRTINVDFSGPIPPAVRRTVNQRTERFLEGLSDYLHAESAKSTPVPNQLTNKFQMLVVHRESDNETQP
jgi:hypothetical protein